MLPALETKLNQSAELRKKLTVLSSYIHKNLVPVRKHHETACEEIEKQFLMQIRLVESDSIIANPHKYTAKAFSHSVISRRRLVNSIEQYLETTAQWAYSASNELRK